MAVFGLYSHIKRNETRSKALIAGLFASVYLLLMGLVVAGSGSFREVVDAALPTAVFTVVMCSVWVWLGLKYNVAMISRMTGAQGLAKEDAPQIHAALEALCISRGLPTPKLAVIETEALNAFASGVTDEQRTVTVTRGLVDTLDRREMEAVLAHELTHIRNGDVKLMIVAVLIAGGVSIAAELMLRGAAVRRSSGSKGKGGGLAVLGLIMIAGALIAAQLIRAALSRSREFLADAGSVELTKDPDALISALMKIEGRSKIEGAPSGVMDMCFAHMKAKSDMFASHPSVADRVQALVEQAGGRLPEPAAQPAEPHLEVAAAT